MYAIEFNTKIDNGKIEIPKEYKDKFNDHVKVILLKTDELYLQDDNLNQKKEANGFGILSHLANKELWVEEDSAWKKIVVNNYDDN